MTLADITVRRFKECLKGNTEGIDNWEQLFTQYVDLSGIGETEEYTLMVAIHNLGVRVAGVNAFIQLQINWYNNFDEPFELAFEDMKKYHIKISYDPSQPGRFLQRLKQIEADEKRNIAEMDSLIKDLEELRKNGVKPGKSSSETFIRTLNALNKEGYRIDNDKTDMEELSLMIRQRNEENK